MSVLMRLVDALNQDDYLSRSLNIGLAVGAGLVLNVLGLWLGRNAVTDTLPWFALPGWVASVVWVFLFALLGASRWMLNSYTIIGVATARTMVTLLIMCCLLWPIYSLPSVDPHISLAGNVATIVLTVATVAVVRRRSIESASLIMPLLVWLAFSTLVVLVQVGWL